jgi:hypothetical protein
MPGDQEQQWNRIIGLYQDIRAECKNLRTLLLEIKNESGKLDENKILFYKKIFESNRDRISERIGVTHILLEENSYMYMYMSDMHANIENYWERFSTVALDFSKQPDNASEIIDRCNENLCEIIFFCGLVTIPRRTNNHLDTLKVGYGLDFYKYYEDELCSKEQAEKILKYLADHPGSIHGIADVDQGLIYKFDPPGERWKSYLWIALGIIGGGVIVSALLMKVLKPEMNFVPILELFFIAFLGAVAHLAIDALKEIRSTDNRHFRALDDIFLWIHVKQLPILAGIGVLIVGFAMVFWLSPVTDIFTFFIAGYGVDSIGDLFIQRFEKTMKTPTDELKKLISPESS